MRWCPTPVTRINRRGPVPRHSTPVNARTPTQLGLHLVVLIKERTLVVKGKRGAGLGPQQIEIDVDPRAKEGRVVRPGERDPPVIVHLHQVGVVEVVAVVAFPIIAASKICAKAQIETLCPGNEVRGDVACNNSRGQVTVGEEIHVRLHEGVARIQPVAVFPRVPLVAEPVLKVPIGTQAPRKDPPVSQEPPLKGRVPDQKGKKGIGVAAKILFVVVVRGDKDVNIPLPVEPKLLDKGINLPREVPDDVIHVIVQNTLMMGQSRLDVVNPLLVPKGQPPQIRPGSRRRRASPIKCRSQLRSLFDDAVVISLVALAFAIQNMVGHVLNCMRMPFLSSWQGRLPHGAVDMD